MKVIYWDVIYSHVHGTDAWPVFAHQCAEPERGPTEDEVIADLGDLWDDPDHGFIDIGQRQEVDIPDTDEIEFWRKTAVELFANADESIIDEHLSSKQVDRLQEAQASLAKEQS